MSAQCSEVIRIAAIRYGREPRQARCLLYSDIVACGHALCLGGLQLWIIVQCDVDCLCWRRRKARKRRRRLEVDGRHADEPRSEEHTSELQSLMRITYAVFCLKK